jgi:3-phosphoshikimate 1-carboxyvinyltransferase
VPGDKSISHRAAIVAAMSSGGRARIDNFSTSADCASTLAALSQLGVSIRREAGAVVVFEGDAGRASSASRGLTRRLRAPSEPLDCGNSGSTMRMLAGLLAGQEFASVLTGDESLRARPMKRIIEPLELMGARLHSQDGRAPLRVEGRAPLDAVRYEMPVASAQVKSAILLAGLNAEGRTEVVEGETPTRDHTERMLRWLGARVETTTETRRKLNEDGIEERKVEGDVRGAASSVVSVEGMKSFEARDIDVPGDISSAAFLIAAAALLEGSELTLEGVGLNPTRTEILRTMRALGADVEASDVRLVCNEETGEVRIRGVRGNLAAGEAGVIDGALVAQLIDELPVLAVVGSQVEGGLRIRDASELRVKESDRIGATVENLRAMGAEVEEYADGLAVGGGARLRGARLRAHGDHRIAMAFTVAALIADGASELEGAECVAVSFPEFFRLLESVAER